MKFLSLKILIAPFVLAVVFSACKIATDNDYDNAAKDICNCMETAFKDFPKPMKDAMIKAGKMPGDFDKNFQDELGKYFEENPLEALTIMSDADKLKFDENAGEKCIKELEKKYKNLTSFESNSQIEQKLLDAINKVPGCELTAVAIKQGNKTK